MNTTNFLLLAVVILLTVASIHPLIVFLVGVLTGILIKVSLPLIKEKIHV